MSAERRSRGRGQGESSEVRLSKFLSWLLRHGAAKERLEIEADGFAPLARVVELALQRDRQWDEAAILRAVATNDKQRFSLSPDGTRIRANQGHSLATVDQLALTRITDPAAVPCVIHGTYKRFWPAIKASGLQKMSRNHVHCAKGMPGSSGVISGMRSDCDVFIHIDAARFIADGLELFESANGVILCAEIPPRYFRAVLGRDGKPIDPDFPAQH